ncbi:T-cell surface glycoprotein CD5, partial [Mesitornis unicolor]
KPERGSHWPVRWEAVEPCESRVLLDCFNRTSARRGRALAFIICSGPQPQALRRLASGPTPCEGDIEVFHEGRWQVLCDNWALRREWGRQLCQELRCGNLSSSTEIQDPPSTGVTCGVPTLHHCSASLGGQDSKPLPTGTPAGTIVSICLALLLFGVLLLICGPPAYRRLMKRISKRKQRQWIGPTGLNQTVSFHRNSTVTMRPRAEGQRAQGGDNDYAQPPQKSSYLSAYPALESASRASNPPDNSSDSDYDLHSARRV